MGFSGTAGPNPGIVLECIDEDECSLGRSSCIAPQACINNPGSYTCGCDDGWGLDGAMCTDLDECALSTHDCDHLCVNNDGSFDCNCRIGYELGLANLGNLPAGGRDGKDCYNINECNDPLTNMCHSTANCFDTEGSFECKCPDEFDGDGFTGCTATMLRNTICKDPPVCSTLMCDYGYDGDPYVGGCFDRDECATASLNTCDTTFSTCENAPGTHYCIPRVGFMLGPGNEIVGQGMTHAVNSGRILSSKTRYEQPKEDIDECSSPNIDCHKHAFCLNTQGGYKCVCKTGFAGDGVSICNAMLLPNVICIGLGYPKSSFRVNTTKNILC